MAPYRKRCLEFMFVATHAQKKNTPQDIIMRTEMAEKKKARKIYMILTKPPAERLSRMRDSHTSNTMHCHIHRRDEPQMAYQAYAYVHHRRVL